MEPDFTSAKLLISRAGYRIDEFNSIFRRFVEKKPYVFRQEKQIGTGVTHHKVALTEDLPIELSAVAFDIVGALRSALDHAVFDAAAVLGGNPKPKYTKFPFGKTAEDVEKDLARKNSEIPTALRDFLIKFEPYEGGNPALWSLNEIRNGKIHRTLEGAMLANQSFGIGNMKGNLSIERFINEWDSRKRELTYMSTTVLPDSGMDVSVTIQVKLGDGTPHEGKPALEFLRASHGEVERVVSAVEAETMRLKSTSAEIEALRASILKR